MESIVPIGSLADKIIEKCREKPGIDDAIVIIEDTSEAEIRYANNRITTNGIRQDRELTLAVVTSKQGLQLLGLQTVSFGTDTNEIDALIERTYASAGPSGEDKENLVEGPIDRSVRNIDPYESSEEADVNIFKEQLSQLHDVFTASEKSKTTLSGFSTYAVTTTHLATTKDIRFHGVDKMGIFQLVKRATTAAGNISSAWVGEVGKDFSGISPHGADELLSARLSWSKRKIDLPPGRYEVIMPPSAVADLMLELYMAADGTETQDGATVFSSSHNTFPSGQPFCNAGASLYSDPYDLDMNCHNVFVTASSGSDSSVFDNGQQLDKTYWLREGVVENLRYSRAGAKKHGTSPAFHVGNLLLEFAGKDLSLEKMIARTKRGLLLTCLWYIREVDRSKLLLTGLTRDGVYLIENGEIAGEVNNFRFNDSPLTLLNNVLDSSSPTPAYPRESGEWMALCKMPTVRVAEFNFDSISQAT